MTTRANQLARNLAGEVWPLVRAGHLEAAVTVIADHSEEYARLSATGERIHAAVAPRHGAALDHLVHPFFD